MNIKKTKLEGCFIIEPTVYKDNRGWFMETYNKAKVEEEIGFLVPEFVQDNHSLSLEQYTLRGIHFQLPPMEQAKLVRCTKGRVYDIAIDLRRNSKTYKQWVGVELSSENKKEFYLPRGFGHGFLTLEAETEIQYKVDNYYSAKHDSGFIYNDKMINIDWPNIKPILSEKDENAKSFLEVEGDL